MPICGRFTHSVISSVCLRVYSLQPGTAMARTKINMLIEKLLFTSIDSKTVKDVKNNKKIHDFEDGLQYYSAIESKCTFIITEDKKDFHFSEIEVLGSRDFIETYVFPTLK